MCGTYKLKIAMSLNDRVLRYFIAIADHGSFTGAAEACGVVQSAISHQIRALEDYCGVKLFERDGKRARLTEAGEALLNGYARKIVGLIDRAELDLKRFGKGEMGRLRIGFQSAASRHTIVADALQALRDELPGVTLDLHAGTGLNMMKEIEDGRLDGAFMYADEHENLDRQLLDTDDWVVAMSASHDLAQRDSLHLHDLYNEPFIWLPREINPILHDRMLATCSAHQMAPRIVQYAFDEPMVLNLVAVGTGIAFVLKSLPPQLNANIVLRPVSDFSVPVELCFVTAFNASELTRNFQRLIAKRIDGRSVT